MLRMVSFVVLVLVDRQALLEAPMNVLNRLSANRRFAFSVAILLLAAFPVRADEASHLEAAQNVFVAMQMDSLFDKIVDQALDQQIRQNPSLLEERAVMKAYFDKYMSWNAIKDDLATLYVATFTEEELNAISEFYRTPVGKKMALAAPDLT